MRCTLRSVRTLPGHDVTTTYIYALVKPALQLASTMLASAAARWDGPVVGHAQFQIAGIRDVAGTASPRQQSQPDDNMLAGDMENAVGSNGSKDGLEGRSSTWPKKTDPQGRRRFRLP
jgi:hypothetical protein